MKIKYKFSNSSLEVKKIKAKLQTTSLVAIAAILLIVSTVNTADASVTESNLIIDGSNNNHKIFIAFDGDTNFVILQNNIGMMLEAWDSKVKTYKSGGFSMKNPESGITVFAHPIFDDKYKLVVLTPNAVYRFIGVSENPNDFDGKSTPVKEIESSNDTIVTERIEPKSSIGSDITKWDIPVISRDDGKDTFLMTFKPTQTLDSLNLGDKFEIDGFVYSVRNSTKIVDVDVTLEISRDDIILRSVETKSGTGGTIGVEISEMIYPLFYPNFCYDVKITMNHGEYTAVWTDDFVMLHNGAWDPDMSWIAEDRWNYLPQSFRDEPRVSMNADEHCN